MASNLITARSLIQADLDHARSVLSLWTHQVAELEKALEQIDAVSSSRNALRVQYQGTAQHAPALESPAASDGRKKRGRKLKNATGGGAAKSAASGNGIAGKRGRKLAERSTVAQVSEAKAKGGKSGKAAQAKSGKSGRAAKYKDPNSDKTWSGLGRRPGWFVGQPEQYEINASGRAAQNESQSGAAATPAGADASAS